MINEIFVQLNLYIRVIIFGDYLAIIRLRIRIKTLKTRLLKKARYMSKSNLIFF